MVYGWEDYGNSGLHFRERDREREREREIERERERETLSFLVGRLPGLQLWGWDDLQAELAAIVGVRV